MGWFSHSHGTQRPQGCRCETVVSMAHCHPCEQLGWTVRIGQCPVTLCPLRWSHPAPPDLGLGKHLFPLASASSQDVGLSTPPCSLQCQPEDRVGCHWRGLPTRPKGCPSHRGLEACWSSCICGRLLCLPFMLLQSLTVCQMGPTFPASSSSSSDEVGRMGGPGEL